MGTIEEERTSSLVTSYNELLPMNVPVFADQQKLCMDTGYHLEDLIWVMAKRDGWR